MNRVAVPTLVLTRAQIAHIHEQAEAFGIAVLHPQVQIQVAIQIFHGGVDDEISACISRVRVIRRLPLSQELGFDIHDQLALQAVGGTKGELVWRQVLRFDLMIRGVGGDIDPRIHPKGIVRTVVQLAAQVEYTHQVLSLIHILTLPTSDLV